MIVASAGEQEEPSSLRRLHRQAHSVLHRARRELRKRPYYQLSSSSMTAFAAPLVLFLPPGALDAVRTRAVKADWSCEYLVANENALGAAVEAALRCVETLIL